MPDFAIKLQEHPRPLVWQPGKRASQRGSSGCFREPVKMPGFPPYPFFAKIAFWRVATSCHQIWICFNNERLLCMSVSGIYNVGLAFTKASARCAICCCANSGNT
jgi:hypothetical protein